MEAPLDNDVRGWIMTIASGIGMYNASLILTSRDIANTLPSLRCWLKYHLY